MHFLSFKCQRDIFSVTFCRSTFSLKKLDTFFRELSMMTNGKTCQIIGGDGTVKNPQNPIKALITLANSSYKEVARALDISERTLITWLTKESVDINYSYIVTLSEFLFPKILTPIIRKICTEAFYICPSEAVWCCVALNDYFLSGVKRISLFKDTVYRHFYKTRYGADHLFFNDCIHIFSNDINSITKYFRSCENIIRTGASDVSEENSKYIPDTNLHFVEHQHSLCRIPFCVESAMGLSPLLCLCLDNRLRLDYEAESIRRRGREHFLNLANPGTINTFENGETAFNEDEIARLYAMLLDFYRTDLQNFFAAVSALNRHAA